MKKLSIALLTLMLAVSCSSMRNMETPSPVYSADMMGVAIEICEIDGTYLISIPSQMIYMLPLTLTEDGSYTLGNTGIFIKGDFEGRAVYTQGPFTDDIEFKKISDDAAEYYARPQEKNIKSYPMTEVEVPLSDGGTLTGCITARMRIDPGQQSSR